jgi:hypothetical protein
MLPTVAYRAGDLLSTQRRRARGRLAQERLEQRALQCCNLGEVVTDCHHQHLSTLQTGTTFRHITCFCSVAFFECRQPQHSGTTNAAVAPTAVQRTRWVLPSDNFKPNLRLNSESGLADT